MAEGDGVLYDKFKEGSMEGLYNFLTATIKAALVYGYTPNANTHEDMADVDAAGTEYSTANGYTAAGVTLGTVTVTKESGHGKFDAADSTWSSLGPLSPTAIPSHAIIYLLIGSRATDILVCYFVLGVTTPNGGDYTLEWASGGIVTVT